MRVRAVVLAGLAAAFMAACSPPASETPNPDNAAAPAGVDQMQPGQYRTTVTVLEMNMPGVPAGMMSQMQARPITTEYCVEESDVSDITSRDIENPESGMDCTVVRASASGGRIDNEATCTGPMGEMHMQMTGTYSPTRVEMETASTTTMAQGTMTQRSQILTERIGDCPTQTPATP